MYASHVEVYRNQISTVNGSMRSAWQKISETTDPLLGIPGEMKCRIDLGFMRPGKDQPSAQVAGRAPDRMGVLLCDPTPYLKAGYIVRCKYGPITGTFEIKTIPDTAVDYSSAHHLEVQVIEVAQSAVDFPGGG